MWPNRNSNSSIFYKAEILAFVTLETYDSIIIIISDLPLAEAWIFYVQMEMELRVYLSCNNITNLQGIDGSLLFSVILEHVAKNRYICIQFNEVSCKQRLKGVSCFVYCHTVVIQISNPRQCTIYVNAMDRFNGHTRLQLLIFVITL